MKESYENWTRSTPERYIFDMLVRRAGTSVLDYLENILEIIAANVENDKDYEVRMDMLSLVEFLLLQESLHSTLIFYGDILMKMILIPSTVWKVGKPNIKIRKAAVICMIKLLEKQLIKKDKLLNHFKELMGVLKSCLDDDWANDLRFTTVTFLKFLIEYLHEEFIGEHYMEIYPELLKRLDDSQEAIRI